ncbi:MAG: pseudouridine synthase [Cellulosilyticaceae bacterium]
MRINKLLSNKGICSRSQAAKWIEEGRVVVNGQLCIQGQWVEEEDTILIDNEPLCEKEKVYMILNKPTGITCTAAPTVEGNILSYINYPEYIFPVGRLDKPSQGLMLLTNDGDLANEILEADHGHEKEYIVTVDKPFDDRLILGLAEGVDIGDTVTRPCTVSPMNTQTFSITITQGLNRQIRRMCKVFGYEVLRLERIRILNVKMGDLAYGKWRHLTEEEVEGLRNIASYDVH